MYATPVRTPVLDVFRPGVLWFCRAYFGLELQGTENIPATGGIVVTPNHQTYADPPLVTIPIRRPVYYMAWSRLFEIPLFGRWIRRLRAFPVKIEANDPSATRAAVRVLQAGEALMIFPEGGRSKDGRVGDFKVGAFRLAVSVGVPVLPVTIAGGHESWPPGRMLPRRGRMRITYHPPLHAEPGAEPRAAAHALAQRTRAVITETLQAERSSTR